MFSLLSAVTAPVTHSHAFGETCTDCKGLGADGSWVFWVMIGALFSVIAAKLILKRLAARRRKAGKGTGA